MKDKKVFWITLLVIGCLDLFRGVMHTVLLEFASANIAGISDPDALFMMIAFGISNYLTGALYILIALKAKDLAPFVLTMIPLIYGSSLLVSPSAGQTAPFNGKYMMMVYFAVTFVIGVWGIVEQRKKHAAMTEPSGV